MGQMMAQSHPGMQLQLRQQHDQETDLRGLRVPSRRALALLCGSSAFVEQLGKPLFMAGLGRAQILDEVFTRR